MGNLKQEAETYEPASYKSPTAYPKISVSVDILEAEHEGKDGTYKVKYFLDEKGDRVRIPVSVLGSLKEILKEKPTLKHFKVTSSGTNMNTKYTVIPVD